MKHFLALFLTVLLSCTALAQGLRPEAVNGAVWGGVAGAIIGHNSGDLRHNAWRGAAIGAGTGLVLGSIIGNHRDGHHRGYRRDHASPYTYIYRSPRGYYGHRGYHGHAGYRHGWRPYGAYYRPGYVYLDRNAYGYYGYSDYDDVVYGGRNYAANGAVLGALAGAVIGHNSGDLRHNGWRGAAYGAAAGYVIGSIAENNARRREASAIEAAPVDVNREEQPASVAANPAPAGSVTASDVRSSSSMSSANSLFGR